MEYFIEFLKSKESFGYVTSSYIIAFLFIFFLKFFSTIRTKKFEKEYLDIEKRHESKT
tara:strand:- start:1204 stop:1377 length:174 start_codon:yes stop_codon:yes gene_type:complete